MSKKIFLSAVILCLITAPTITTAQDSGEASTAVRPSQQKALEISEKNQDALVLVEFVVTVNVKIGNRESQPNDTKHTAKGVVIRKDGLVVAPNSQSDPTSALRQQLEQRAGGQNVEVSTTIKKVKIIKNDGSEIEAEVAIKDADIDLTLVRPKESLDGDMPAVSLDPDAKPGQLDPIIILARMGMDAGRAVLVVRGYIRGIIEKPRKYYILQQGDVGVPAFDARGRCFGIYLGRSNASGRAVGNTFVLPSSDILAVIKQIP